MAGRDLLRAHVWLACLMCSSVLPGCIPVAWFASEHRIAGGIMGGRMRGAASEPLHDATGPSFQYRGSIAPLSMVPDLWDREFDFDLGYFVMVHDGGDFQHGPSVALTYFAIRQTLDFRPACPEVVEPEEPLEIESAAVEPQGEPAQAPIAGPDCAPHGYHQLFRLAPRAELDLRFADSESAPGFGGRLGLRFDFSWLEGQPQPGASVGRGGGFVGVTWGESGVAFDILAGGGTVGSQYYGEIIFTLTLRAPAIAGLVIILPT